MIGTFFVVLGKIVWCALLCIPCLLPLLMLYTDPPFRESVISVFGKYFFLAKIGVAIIAFAGVANFIRMSLKILWPDVFA